MTYYRDLTADARADVRDHARERDVPMQAAYMAVMHEGLVVHAWRDTAVAELSTGAYLEHQLPMIRWAVTMRDGDVIELSARTDWSARQRAERHHRHEAESALPYDVWLAAQCVKAQADYDALGIHVVGLV